MLSLAEKSSACYANIRLPHFQHQPAAAALGVCAQELQTDQEPQPAVVWWQPVLVCSACTVKDGVFIVLELWPVLEAHTDIETSSSGLPVRGSGF